MADIRINALPTTATDFASDDYIAIDGTTNGTRKLNAKTANLTFSDVTLGTSGPSVKSTLSARAPRQGLVFDGTAVTTSWAGNVLGTGDFTASAWIYIREQPAASQIKDIFSSTGGSAFALRVNTYGGFFFDVASTYSGGTNLIDATPYIGKWAHVVYSRSYSGTTTFYVNGVSAATRSPNDTTNYSGTTNTIGTNAFPGTIAGTYLYNRALSASEVVALYEAGAPAGADYYNTGAGAASVANVSSGDVSTVFTGVSASGFTATRTGGSGRAYVNLAGKFGYLRRGTKISIKATLTVTGTWYISQDAFATTTQLTTGSFNLTMTGVAANDYIFIFTDDANATLVWASNSSQALGLLLAPDAAQAGGGLTWYDTSGNAANITLPASGVSWNVPTSGRWGGNFGVGGGTTLTSFDTTYSASQVTGSLSLLGDNVAAIYGNNIYYNAGWKYSKASFVGLYVQNNAGIGDHAWYTAASGSVGGAVSLTQAMTLKNGGNLLIGKTTPDTGEKLQVAGGIAATGLVDITGPDNSGANGVGNLKVYAANRTALLTFNYQNINASGALLLSTAGTTALTLDSSQNATFAGKATATQFVATAGSSAGGSVWASSGAGLIVQCKTGSVQDFVLTNPSATSNVFEVPTGTVTMKLGGALRLNNAYTAGAPTATGYVTIQDSAGNTYKVLVGT